MIVSPAPRRTVADTVLARHRLRGFELVPWIGAIAAYFVFPEYLALGGQILLGQASPRAFQDDGPAAADSHGSILEARRFGARKSDSSRNLHQCRSDGLAGPDWIN